MSISMSSKKPDIIGVLDLQGGVHEHLDHLRRLGIKTKRVKQKTDFAALAGCIIPGGESSCISRLLNIFDIKSSLLQAYEKGMKIWGTCAGAILLAKKIVGETACLPLIDIEIERNSFGSQLDSFQTNALIPQVSTEIIPLIFIRAPKILKAGKGVNVLLKIDDYIAAAENDNILVTAFHPELTACTELHRYFAVKCGLVPADNKTICNDPEWQIASWTQLARII